MRRMRFLVAMVALLGVNVALAVSDAGAADDATTTRSCACYGGSGPEPKEPGEPFCMEWMTQQCIVDENCTC